MGRCGLEHLIRVVNKSELSRVIVRSFAAAPPPSAAAKPAAPQQPIPERVHGGLSVIPPDAASSPRTKIVFSQTSMATTTGTSRAP